MGWANALDPSCWPVFTRELAQRLYRTISGRIGVSTVLSIDEKPYGHDAVFGHGMKKYFSFDQNYVNLNHGSYGSVPIPVQRYVQEMSDICEACPDRFMRYGHQSALNQARERVAKLIGAETDECVIVPNASHGISTVLRNFEWNAGDIIVGFSTSYASVSRTLYYISDSPPYPTLSAMPLTFPESHANILTQFRAHLRSLPKQPGNKVVVLIDGIVSNPGVLMPWEAMVAICREEGAYSVVDAAHSIGQVTVNLEESQPDFWVSNCHKWLMSKRGSAILYVPKRNQSIIKSSFPTSFAYVSPKDVPPREYDFVKMFEWTGTIDYVSYLSINAALDFRESIGGELKIQDYCNDLARKGGARMAELLGTRVMDANGDLMCHMVNVELPLPVDPEVSDEIHIKVYNHISHSMLADHNCYVALYMHDKKWWARASAQIWNEISDFEYTARAIIKICEKIKQDGPDNLVTPN